jgi:hypothetical protein
MARKKRLKAGEAFLYSVAGILAIVIMVGQFLMDHIIIVASLVFIPLIIFAVVKIVNHLKNQNNISASYTVSHWEDSPGLGDARHHLEQARNAERNGDYLAARMSYLKCVETLKQMKALEELKKASGEYKKFVKRDPIFGKLVDIFIAGIRENPGILQSDITKKVEDMDWSELYNKNRSIAKDDIRYVLYFAEEFGDVIRKKEGRSYRLYLPEQL